MTQPRVNAFIAANRNTLSTAPITRKTTSHFSARAFFLLSNGADKVVLSKECHPVRRFPGIAMLRNLIGARPSKVSRDRIVLVSDPVYRDQTVKQEQRPNGPDIRTGH